MGKKLIGIVASVGGGEVSEAGGRRTGGEERRIVHLSATQLHPTPPNASLALVESPALPAGEAAAAATKSILGLRDSAAACEPAPALWAPTWSWQPGPNVGLARSRRTDHALTTQPTQSKCRTGANCFFLEVTRGRRGSVRLAQ